MAVIVNYPGQRHLEPGFVGPPLIGVDVVSKGQQFTAVRIGVL